MYAYDQYRMFEPLVESRTIASGRAMEFPIMGTVNMKPAWFAGEELIGNTGDHVSKTFSVTLDNRPIASYFELDNIDLMITQWQYRQELARQAGQTLANARDLQIGAYIVRAAAEEVIENDPRLRDTSAEYDWNRSLKDSPSVVPLQQAGVLRLCECFGFQRADGALALAAIEEYDSLAGNQRSH